MIERLSKELELVQLRLQQFQSLLTFTRTFYRIRTGRDFVINQPVSRESHYLTIARALEGVIIGKCRRLIINVPPRYGKSELLIHFIAWSLARYPDSNYLYVSYSHSLAKKQTQTIRSIVNMAEYRSLFGFRLTDDTQAKDDFETTSGGSVYAAGAGGTITGRGAGIKGSSRFGGIIGIDDIHKPDEATSDTIREGIIEWYYNTLVSRTNDPTTPIVYIGQRVHEHDLASMLRATGEWDEVVIPAIDPAGNALDPSMHDIKALRKMEEESPYNFASQYMQDPQPAGGGIFKREWFKCLERDPEVFDTFMTVDSAETVHDYNDATVFSFWGIYEITYEGRHTGVYALHWLACRELRIEPKDLESEFMDFYRHCMLHPVKPHIVAIERKSTGVTLASVLKDMQGLRVLDIARTKASGSKTQRYLEIQPYVSTKRVSLPMFGEHTEQCIEHCRKITANNTHRHDDIADTLYDAVKLALIDGVIGSRIILAENKHVARAVMGKFRAVQSLKDSMYGLHAGLPKKDVFK